MPKVTMSSKEIIETIKQFSEESSKENKNILEKILNKIDEQNKEIVKLREEIADLKKKIGSGSINVSTGGTSSSTNQTSGDTTSGPTEAQLKEKAWNDFFAGKNDITDKEGWKNSGLTIENAKKVYDNGWNDKIREIKNATLPNYKTPNTDETDTNLDVLKVVRTELDKANGLIKEIKSTTTFKQIDDWKTSNKNKVKELADDKLPGSKQQKGIEDIIKNHRNTFTYKINVESNEKENDGLTQANLETALGEINDNKKEPQKYKPLTAKILNDFLNASDLKISEVDEKGEPKLNNKKEPITNPVKIEGNAVEDLDAPNEELYGKDENDKPRSWLEFQGAFKLPKELTDKEEHLDLKIKGSESLPYFYKKNNYDPENPAWMCLS